MKTPPDDLAAKLFELSEDVLAQSAELRIDDVATATGVPRATLYYYFSGPSDLLVFLMSEKAQRMGAAVRAALDERGRVVDRLGRVIEAMVRSMADAPSLCVNMLGAMGQGETMVSLIMTSEQVVFAPVRELLIEGRATGELVVDDLDAAVAAIGGAVLMASIRSYFTTGAIDADGVAPSLIATLVDGLRTR